MQKYLIKTIWTLLAVSLAFYFYKRVDQVSNDGKEQPLPGQQDVELSEDFINFYNTFHTDSIFQLNHIIFPLAGKTQLEDKSLALVDTLWQRGGWRVHRPFNDMDGTFERSFTNDGGIVTEVISGGGQFYMVKRYAQLSKEWHLIFYQDLTMIPDE